MGKASRNKKKLIQGARIDKSKFLKSSKSYVAPQVKEGLQKSVSEATFLLFIIIILITSFSVYFNSLYNGFVYDDRYQVLQNSWITNIKYIPEMFSRDVWGFRQSFGLTNYYRPMMNLLYMINFYLFGLKPWGFHMVNILFHAGVSVLVFIIALRLLRESQPSTFTTYLTPSFIAALLFATHPIHTEAVTWVAGLPDVSFTFFYFFSFYLYIRSTNGNLPMKGTYILSVALFFLATLCKEPALTLPIILVAYDYTFRRSDVQFTSALKKYIPYLVVAGCYFILRFHALGNFAPAKQHTELNTYQYFINIFPLFTQYLEKLILPVNLSAFYVLHPILSLFEMKGSFSLIITVSFALLLFISYRKNKTVFFGLLFIIIPLLPVLYIPVLGKNTFTERYLYLSSFGFVVLLASLINWAKVNRPKVAVSLIVISTIVMGLYSLGTIRRNTVWKDDYTLFADTVRKSPDSDMSHYDFGLRLQENGKIDEAIEQYQIALKLNPDYVDAHNNLGVVFLKKGKIDEAIEQYQIALKLNPDDAVTHTNLGLAFLNKGWIDKAIEQYQIALKLNPDLVEAHSSLGLAFFNKGWIDKATEQFQIALKLNIDSAVAHNGLGVVFFNKGWTDKATEQFQIALKLDPNLADAHNNMGVLYKKSGDIDKAIGEYEAAVRLNPSNIDFRNNLARAYELRNSAAKTKVSKK